MGQLPNNVNDIFSINGLTNIINKPTHFDSRTGNSSLLDPILITDNVPLIDSDIIHIDRKISDHDGTCVTIRCGYSNLKLMTPEILFRSQRQIICKACLQ
jgi:hypothetical protein